MLSGKATASNCRFNRNVRMSPSRYSMSGCVARALFSIPRLKSTPVTVKLRLNTQSWPPAPLPICSNVRGGSAAECCISSTYAATSSSYSAGSANQSSVQARSLYAIHVEANTISYFLCPTTGVQLRRRFTERRSTNQKPTATPKT